MQENIDEERGECENGISLSEEKNLNNRKFQQGNFYIRIKNFVGQIAKYGLDNSINIIHFFIISLGDLHKVAKRSTSTVKDWLQIAALNVRSIFQPRPDPAQDRLINLFAQSRRRPRLINSLKSRDNLLEGKTTFLILFSKRISIQLLKLFYVRYISNSCYNKTSRNTKL